MREINVQQIQDAIKEMCIETNHFLSSDMKIALLEAKKKESSLLGIKILEQLETNLEIAGNKMIPICQDTGMVVVFAKVGQEVSIRGGDFETAINNGIALGYEEGYLRKSVVSDPLLRINTGDNTPGIIHTQIVQGDQITLTVAPKGFGSENMSRIYMLKPCDGRQGVIEAVVETVREAGPNACPPLVIGVGIGGDFEKSAQMAKEALTRLIGQPAKEPHLHEIEEEILSRVNKLKIGPAGLGGDTTALAVHMNSYPTHIAGMPVAINLCCHVNRHATRVL